VGAVYAGGELVARVERSGFTEGYHRGSVIVLDAAGAPVASAGDVLGAIFPRSSNKPMQAVAMLRAGLAYADPADLAISAASHSGEAFHVDRVRKLLATGGFTEDDLRCPPALPLSLTAQAQLLAAGGGPTRVTMNCSGKHAAMLLTCRENGWPTGDYFAPEHPLQQRIAATVAELAGEPVAATGVDGCGAPVLALSLTGLARAFLRLVEAAPGSDERAVADAMRGYPELVSGTGADDARLLRGLPGALAKGGAEGVLAVAVPGAGAVAIKVDDGARRPRLPLLAGALRRLGVTAPILAELAASADGVLQYGRGEPVGAVLACWEPGGTGHAN
jgi:L-asparaginase II